MNCETSNERLIMKMSPARRKFIDVATSKHGAGAVLTRSMIVEVAEEYGVSYPSWFSRSTFSVGRGEFRLPVDGEVVVDVPVKPAKVEKLLMLKSRFLRLKMKPRRAISRKHFPSSTRAS